MSETLLIFHLVGKVLSFSGPMKLENKLCILEIQW